MDGGKQGSRNSASVTSTSAETGALTHGTICPQPHAGPLLERADVEQLMSAVDLSVSACCFL